MVDQVSEPRPTNGSVWVVMEPPETEPNCYGRIAGVYATWYAMAKETDGCDWSHAEDSVFMCDKCKRIAERFWLFA